MVHNRQKRVAFVRRRGRQAVSQFCKLGAAVLAVCGLSFGPWIYMGQLHVVSCLGTVQVTQPGSMLNLTGTQRHCV